MSICVHTPGAAAAIARSRSHGSSCRKRYATSKVAPPQHSNENARASSLPATAAPLARSIVRTRVASSDWCASRIVVSVTSTRVCARTQRAIASGPSASSTALALGSGAGALARGGVGGASGHAAGARPLKRERSPRSTSAARNLTSLHGVVSGFAGRGLVAARASASASHAARAGASSSR